MPDCSTATTAAGHRFSAENLRRSALLLICPLLLLASGVSVLLAEGKPLPPAKAKPAGSTADARPGTSPASSTPAKEKIRVAGVVTLFGKNSHPEVICGRLMAGENLNGQAPYPGLELVSLYIDQPEHSEYGLEMAKKHGVPVFDTITGALTLGGEKLAVDGVLLVAEHGKYEKDVNEQKLYPKLRLFTEIAGVIEASGRSIPVFSDKHLSHTWSEADAIYRTARRLNIPLMAGSSLPSYQRKPALNVPQEAPLEQIIVVGYGSNEAYGFHALEALQCLAERRKGGETGVKSVQALTGDAVWAAGEAGLYDPELLQAALDAGPRRRRADKPLAESVRNPSVVVIEYRDGLRGLMFMLNGTAVEFTAAWKPGPAQAVSDPSASEQPADQSSSSEPAGNPASPPKHPATLFSLQEVRPYSHFTYLVRGVEQMMRTGKATWPVERTLLTTGILNASMISRKENGRLVETPYLDIKYQSNWEWSQPPPPIVTE